MSETLKQLAAALREKASAYEAEKTAQCAKVLAGAKALHLLREKVIPHVR